MKGETKIEYKIIAQINELANGEKKKIQRSLQHYRMKAGKGELK